MRVMLIRHASTEDGDDLSARGRGETRALAAQLRRLQAVPSVICTSSSGDAQETARVLRGELGLPEHPAYVLDALTPPSGQHWFAKLLDELERVDSEDTVAIVGNEPRLNLIVAESTGSRSRPLARAEAISIAGEDLLQYRRGEAEVEFRTGLKGEPEDVLRDKLHSKTAVTTLLAGFTFAGLVEVLTGGALSGLEAAAAVLLTLSLGLLVACIYVYDQLALPAGFWSAAERSIGKESGLRPRLLRPLETFGHRFRMWTSGRAERRRAGFVFLQAFRNHGVVYSYMVWTWTWIFTPAVVAGLAGFVLLLVATERTLVILGGIAALAFAVGLYLAVRPRLGTD
jgi:phosphohistidine phosphatase SixA